MKRNPNKAHRSKLRQIEKKLVRAAADKSSANKIPLPIKLRMATLILRLMQRRKKFGLFVILGWSNRWKKYADTPDASQDLFSRHKVNIMKVPDRGQPERRVPGQNGRNVGRTITFDGAILVDARGTIVASGAMIEGLRPRATAAKLNPHRAPDLSTRFGFRHKVHMRHIAAITSSYLFRGTTIFTVSEETDDLHIFEGGRIIYSTVPGEPKRIAMGKK